MLYLARALCLLILVTVPASPAPGRDTPDQDKKKISKSRSKLDQRVVGRWKEKIEAINLLIREDRAQEALQEADALTVKMLNSIVSGDDVGRYLGVVYTLRALAAVQTGDRDQGLWHWHIGAQMFPGLKSFDLASYGEAGRFLAAHPPKPLGASGTSLEVGAYPVEAITPPKKLSTPRPKYPKIKRRMGTSFVRVVVQTIIDVDGRPRAPRILISEGELTMVCAALEALRNWRFEPAQYNGHPVAAYYNLSVNFRLK